MRAPSSASLLGPTHGLAYVYVIYGMHLCLNVTANATGPGAVLLRAVQPTEGLALMRERRGAVKDLDLCRGPGRLAQAFGVTRDMNGREFLDLFELTSPDEPPAVVAGPRVGISRAVELPWRLCLQGSRHVSSPRPPA
jgi:DNA-3-methyladenine glycosylase